MDALDLKLQQKEEKRLIAKQKKKEYNALYSKARYHQVSNLVKVNELVKYYEKKFKDTNDQEIDEILSKSISEDYTQKKKLYRIKLLLFLRNNEYLLN
jgi:translation initiation factor 6 (eIF-6)